MTAASDAYLKALNDQAVAKYLAALNAAKTAPTATVPTNPAPTAPAATAPSYTAPTGGGGLLSDGQGGYIPAPGTNFGTNYGIVAQMPDGRVTVNTPQGVMGFSNAASAQDELAKQGIPYQPALPVTGSASPDQLNSFSYGVNSDGSPSNAAQQAATITGLKSSTDSALDQGALGYLTDLLKKYGLESLAPWAMDMLKSGASQYEIIQQLRDRPEYKTRFAGLDQRRQKGLGALSEDEYIAFENTTKDYMQRAGLPSTFYDAPDDFANLIGSFANVGQVADRIEKGYQRVENAPPEVRQAFASYFGVQGDGALAAFFLDPDKAQPVLEKMAAQAVIGGTGLRQGLGISQGMAGSLADLQLSDAQIQSGFGQAGQLGDLQYQTVDEAAAKAAGITADSLTSGVFGLQGSDTQALKDRLGTRKAQFDSKGSAAASQQGAFGLGVAQ